MRFSKFFNAFLWVSLFAGQLWAHPGHETEESLHHNPVLLGAAAILVLVLARLINRRIRARRKAAVAPAQ